MAATTRVSTMPIVPLDFVENQGQWHTPARFVARKASLIAAFEEHAIRVQVRPGQTNLLNLIFEGAADDVSLAGEGRRRGHYNFFVGSDPQNWRSAVSAYESVLYRGLYRGVDARVHEVAERLEYDLMLAPEADLAQVVIRVDGATGIEIGSDGSLIVDTPAGSLRQRPPTTWEALPNGQNRPLASHFRKVDPHRYGFEAPDRDRSLALVIDPGLEWSISLGGGGSDPVGGVATARDGTGDVFVASASNSPDFPSLDPAAHPGSNNSVCVVRVNASGSALLYTTFVGGWHSQILYRGLATNAFGDLVVGGETYSADFPTTDGAFDRTRDGNSSDGFVFRLNSTGGLKFSTFLGGSNPDYVAAVAFEDPSDPSGSIIAGGGTSSSDFPTTSGAFATTYNTPNAVADGGAHTDMFVARLSWNLSQLQYGTYIGGPSADVLEDLAVDPQGFVNVVGWVTGNKVKVFVTTPGAFDTTWNGSQDAAFARLKLDGAGDADLKYATLLGGSNQDNAVCVAIDPNNPEIVVVGGQSWSDNFPTTPGVLKPTSPPISPLFPSRTGFITRFRLPATGGGTLLWSTYFGSAGFETAGEAVSDVAIGNAGEVIVAGRTERAEFPTTRGAFDRTYGGLIDGFLARISANGAALIYSTFFGGNNDDADAHRLTPLMDYVGGNTVLVAGATFSTDFPITPGALDTTHQKAETVGTEDGYALKLTLEPDNTGDLIVDAPVPVSPIDGSTSATSGYVTLEWTPVSDSSGIEAYVYQVSSKPDFPANFIQYKGSVKDTRALLTQLAEVTWYWRVRAADRAGNLSAWSAASSFGLGVAGGSLGVSSIGIDPRNVIGGSSATGIAYLTSLAPAGGAVMTLSVQRPIGAPRSVSLPASVPASVSVPAGASQATFHITTTAVSKSVSADILASIGGVGKRAGIGVNPAAAVTPKAVEITPFTVSGGNSLAGTVILNGPAPAGGIEVTLSSTHPAAVRAPDSVIVPGGATTATFPITTFPVSVDIDAVIRAQCNAVEQRATVRVRPSLPTLTAITLNPSTVSGGSRTTGTLTFSGPMPATRWPAGPNTAKVWISDPDVAGILSGPGAIAAGATSATFQLWTRGPATTRTITVSAAFDRATLTAQLTINAAPPVSLSSVTLQPSTVNGGQSGVGRVNLSTAPTVSVLVTLSANNPALVTIPPNVTVAQGSMSASFSFTTPSTSTAGSATITASFGSATASSVLTVNPSTAVSKIPLSSITLNPATVTGGASSTGTATLASPAHAGGVVVELGTSNSAVAMVPMSITVPAGAMSAPFTVSTATVTTTTGIIIGGLADNTGLSQTAGLTITANDARPSQPVPR